MRVKEDIVALVIFLAIALYKTHFTMNLVEAISIKEILNQINITPILKSCFNEPGIISINQSRNAGMGNEHRQGNYYAKSFHYAVKIFT